MTEEEKTTPPNFRRGMVCKWCDYYDTREEIDGDPFCRQFEYHVTDPSYTCDEVKKLKYKIDDIKDLLDSKDLDEKVVNIISDMLMGKDDNPMTPTTTDTDAAAQPKIPETMAYVEHEDGPKVCPICGNYKPSNVEFCPSCGG